MKNSLYRLSAGLLALFIVVSLLPMSISAAHTIVTTPTGYTSAADVNYVKDGKYVANWGARGEVCVFLSSYAQNFYTGSNTFEALSALTGGSSQNNAPQSALYSALKSFMTGKQTYQTSYKATRELYRYTDCLRSDYSKISSFYSGTMLNGNWDGGDTWNREHTWPNSKGLGGNDENDIMMLRPTAKSENFSRGNKAYGSGSGYYDPGTDVRGDVARIFLYVYTRWGNTSGNGQYTAWGSSGVIQSLDVLLDWMEEDPVDTWEMGRNDAVQSITGTRNVFVDYPEFAWLLFGQDVPSGITTPSDNDGVTANPGGGSSDDSNTGSGGNTDSGNAGGSSSGGSTTTTVNWVSAPQAGVAYKLGLYQQTNGENVYFNGKLHDPAYYLGTTKDYSSAVDVYLESVSDGFKIYFNDGSTKKYIKVYQNGTHTNAGIADGSTDTVFTWDASKKAFVTEIGGEQFYLGTYSYYSSIGVSAIDKLNGSFTAQLCTTSTSTGGNNSGNTGGNSDNTGNSGNTTTPPVTQPPATQPPVTQPPVTQPPVTEPDTSEGTQTSTPATQSGQPAPLPMASVNPDDFISKDEPNNGNALVIILAIVAVVLVAGAVAVYFFVIKPKKNTVPVVEATPVEEISEEAPAEEPTEKSPSEENE